MANTYIGRIYAQVILLLINLKRFWTHKETHSGEQLITDKMSTWIDLRLDAGTSVASILKNDRLQMSAQNRVTTRPPDNYL